MSYSLVIIGAGGFGKEFAWVAESINQAQPEPVWNILGFLDDASVKWGVLVYGYPVLGGSDFTLSHDKEIYFALGIGNNKIRQKLAQFFLKKGWKPASLIHPTVQIAKDVSIGQGVFIAHNALVAPSATIGDFCCINTFSGIGHDTIIGDYAMISPGARVNGHCSVGKFATIGSNASVHPGISVGEYANVAANAQVIMRVKPGKTVIGTPALTLNGVGED